MDTIFYDSAKTNLPANSAAKKPGISRVLKRVLLMDRMVDLLVEKTKSGLFWPDLYIHAQRVLESLPQSSPGNERAKRHLGNALRYSRHLEFGAATFELRMLRNQLA